MTVSTWVTVFAGDCFKPVGFSTEPTYLGDDIQAKKCHFFTRRKTGGNKFKKISPAQTIFVELVCGLIYIYNISFRVYHIFIYVYIIYIMFQPACPQLPGMLRFAPPSPRGALKVGVLQMLRGARNGEVHVMTKDHLSREKKNLITFHWILVG